VTELSRRELLKGAALAAAAAAITPSIAEAVTAGSAPELVPAGLAARATMKGVPFARHETVRFGIVGMGLRGRSVLSELLAIPGVKIVALCDTVPDKILRATKMCSDAGQAPPMVYTGSDKAYEQLCARDDIDFVYTATPWEWHVPVMLAAMKNGKHCGSECPIGTTLKELWSLVDASEKSKRHCLHLENCNYGETEMLVNRLVHEGVFGEILHVEAAYLHDLRRILFEDRDEGLWRRAWHTRSNSNLYPTHGLGPVSWYLDVNAGDRYDYIVAMAGPHRGLELHREATVPDRSNAKWKEEYVNGDHNTSLLKTIKGKTVMLQHNVANPRPYTRHNRVQGTRGAFEDYPPRIYVEGQAGGERWATVDEWKAKFTHPLWQKYGAEARRVGGHGGMDYIMAFRLVQTMQEGLVPDFDVYDAATWSAPLPLSEISIAKGSAPVKFPDFTRGAFASARTTG
jgi:predicted dehydrogenase